MVELIGGYTGEVPKFYTVIKKEWINHKSHWDRGLPARK